jgi:hypothetical protein
MEFIFVVGIDWCLGYFDGLFLKGYLEIWRV